MTVCAFNVFQSRIQRRQGFSPARACCPNCELPVTVWFWSHSVYFEIAQALGCSLSWSNFQLPLLGGERAQCSSAPPGSSSSSSNSTPSAPADGTAPPPPTQGNVQRHRLRNLLQGGPVPGLPPPSLPTPGPSSSTASGEVTLTSLIGVQDQLLQSGLVQEWQVRAVCTGRC